jgi:hypothetical protein
VTPFSLSGAGGVSDKSFKGVDCVGVGTGIASLLAIVAVVGGLALAIVSAFFGIVIPSKIGGHETEDANEMHERTSATA